MVKKKSKGGSNPSSSNKTSASRLFRMLSFAKEEAVREPEKNRPRKSHNNHNKAE